MAATTRGFAAARVAPFMPVRARETGARATRAGDAALAAASARPRSTASASSRNAPERERRRAASDRSIRGPRVASIETLVKMTTPIAFRGASRRAQDLPAGVDDAKAELTRTRDPTKRRRAGAAGARCGGSSVRGRRPPRWPAPCHVAHHARMGPTLASVKLPWARPIRLPELDAPLKVERSCPRDGHAVDRCRRHGGT